VALELDEKRIAEIVDRVVARLGPGPSAAPGAGGPIGPAKTTSRIPRGTLGVYADPDQAVAAARRGIEANEKAPLALRARMIAAMREVMRKNLEAISAYAFE
jgi:hypothetical protein